jgi:Mg-chelatase subunit ChlD
MGDTESAIRVLSDGYILLESAQLETELSQYLDIVEIRQMLAGQYGEELTVSIQQIDVTDFPTIRVYVDVRDANGVSPDDIKPEFFFLSECQSGNGEYIRRDVEHVTQLDGKESISFNLIADISGSMQGEPLSRAKTIMTNFLETVQFNIGDLVELIAFSNDFSVITPFTSDKSQLAYNIGSLTSYGETALYDALVNAIYLTKDQNGAKTIIAFTDGMDNRSYYSANEVIEIANYYKVPIFIIGIGAGVESRILEQIAISTGGFYRSVSQVDESMQEIYQAIFTAEKEKYMLEYTADAAYAATEARNIVVEIGCRDYAGTSETFEYAPQAHYGYFNGLYLPNGEWDPELFILELNKRYISPSELDQFSEEQIAYIRNGLYALSGKEFKRDKFIDYFNSKPWYSPYAFYLSDPEIVSQFNSYQSANWNIVIAYEAVRGWR